MSKLTNENQLLPNEILEKIFVNLNIGTIRSLNKRWKNFSDTHSHEFNVELNIDLLKTDIKILKKFNPVTINITCSQIHDKIPQIYYNDDFMNEESDDDYDYDYDNINYYEYNIRNKRIKYDKCYKNDDKIIKEMKKKELKIIKIIKTKLNIIKKYKNIKTINIKLDMIYLIDDSLKTTGYLCLGGLTTTNLKNNTLSVFCIKHLLQCKAENFFLTIDNYKNIYNWNYSLRYEYFIKDFLILHGYKYNIFIFKGSYDMFFIYNKKFKKFIYRVGNLNQFREQVKTSWDIGDYIKSIKFKNYKNNLKTLEIYSDFYDLRFNTSSKYIKKLNCKNYNYFTDCKNLSFNLKIRPYNLNILKNDIEYNLKSMILKEYKINIMKFV